MFTEDQGVKGSTQYNSTRPTISKLNEEGLFLAYYAEGVGVLNQVHIICIIVCARKAPYRNEDVLYLQEYKTRTSPGQPRHPG